MVTKKKEPRERSLWFPK